MDWKDREEKKKSNSNNRNNGTRPYMEEDNSNKRTEEWTKHNVDDRGYRKNYSRRSKTRDDRRYEEEGNDPRCRKEQEDGKIGTGNKAKPNMQIHENQVDESFLANLVAQVTKAIVKELNLGPPTKKHY